MKVARCPLKYSTQPSRSKLLSGKPRYIGRVHHNQTLTREEIVKGLAEYMNVKEAMSAFYVDGLCGYMRQELARGNRLDFGDFSAEIVMEGGLPSANAPFDEGVNKLKVQMRAKKKLERCLECLAPENVSGAGQSRISSVLQRDGGTGEYEEITTDGRRKITSNGVDVKVHADAADEGVWIEDDAGERLLHGEVFETSVTTCDFYLEGHLDPGEYWLAIYSRGSTKKLLRARRRIHVVA